ncbi:MAG: right-handed parallel beta-helix repeat-containing protein [Mucilaginibacter sp.]|nr:right-handed parallel beta-helix repeat-containing protein [Mucilaginibacter sp.]
MKTVKLIISALFITCTIIATAQQRTYNITAYGAKFDLKVNNAVNIQKAIDAAAAAGGGRVLIPAGVYVTGALNLKSGVELHLDDNAILMGSSKILDYPHDKLDVISAIDQKNISITGNGIIDGNAHELMGNVFELLRKGTITDPAYLLKRPDEHSRTGLILMRNCSNITVKDIKLKNAASWVQDYEKCTDLTIDHITVESMTYWNNDGIDLTDCKNVKVSNCFVNSADDGICLKSTDKNASCDNILVTDCTVRSSASAFKIGTGSAGGFKNITVRNLVVYDTYRSAIALETVDGAFMENIDIRNVVARNTGNAIFIRLGHRNKDERYSSIKHVYISDVKADIPNAKPDIGYPLEGPPPKPIIPRNLNPAVIAGIPGHAIEDVTLENIDIAYGGGGDKKMAYISTDSLNTVKENIPGYPEFTMFGEVPAYGLYVRHTDNIKLKNINIQLATDDYRPAFIFDDVKSVDIQTLNLPVTNTFPAIVLKDVSSSSLKSLGALSGNAAAVKKQ